MKMPENIKVIGDQIKSRELLKNVNNRKVTKEDRVKIQKILDKFYKNANE